jgi:hypothetical protein
MWYDIIDTSLLTFSFKKSVANTNLYILKQDNQLVILALYVDDAILVNIDVDGSFKSKLAKEFAMTNLGHIQCCLEIQIRKDRLNCTIYMHQAKYIETKLQMFKLEIAKLLQLHLK